LFWEGLGGEVGNAHSTRGAIARSEEIRSMMKGDRSICIFPILNTGDRILSLQPNPNAIAPLFL
jgi:hypothetical protein